MSLKLVAFAATCVLQAFSFKRHEVSKWSPCPLFSNGLEDKTLIPTVECGKFSAPLCYSDICTAPESVNQTVELFVKRFPASNPETAINIWIRGRQELSAFLLNNELNTNGNVYVMVVRGSGKSTILDCGVTTSDSDF
ncbi:uncharacterized protein PHALS_01869, partial [Plasmopara halstedii]